MDAVLTLILILAVLAISIGMLTTTGLYISGVRTAPAAPKGANGLDYDALSGQRQTMGNSPTTPITTPMYKFSIATANYGGILTEDMATTLAPGWTGTVSEEAIHLQIAAGARAIVLDIWPDPANRKNAVVCSMRNTESKGLSMFSKGLGDYSNWCVRTRNKVAVASIVNAAVKAGLTNSPPNPDPLFIILRLHGAMTKEYLDTLGNQLKPIVSGLQMNSQYMKLSGAAGLTTLFSAPFSAFAGCACIIASPDVQTAFPVIDSAAGPTTPITATLDRSVMYSKFTAAYQRSSLWDITNYLETAPGEFTVGTDYVQSAQAPQDSSGFHMALAKLVQPSIGGTRNDNKAPDAYNTIRLSDCLAKGIMFPAINLLSPLANDPAVQDYFAPKVFDVKSFVQKE
jgi:hypothetical protein